MATKKRKLNDECRVFQEKWTSDYFFIVNSNKLVCLICKDSVSAFKEYNVKRHYQTRHSDFEKYTQNERKEKVKILQKQISTQQNLFKTAHETSSDVVEASFLVSKEIAQNSKSFSDGEFVKKCLLVVVQKLCPDKLKLFESVSLSRRTVVRRIEDMSSDVETSLKVLASTFKSFSIALDESVDVTSTAQLAVFIRGVDESFVLTEELLELEPINGTTTGQDIFEKLSLIFEKFDLKWESLAGITTDGAPSMVSAKYF